MMVLKTRACIGKAAVVVFALLVGACASNEQELILSEKSAVELRAMQSRMFETNDSSRVFKAVIAMFQDLGYSVAKVEPSAGTVSADKLAMLNVTATVYPRGETHTVVRSNAVVKMAPGNKQGHQVDDPEFYQIRFFEPLSKSLFLTALQIEDDEEPEGDDAAPDSGDEGAPEAEGKQE